jgi:hypothetical protein
MILTLFGLLALYARVNRGMRTEDVVIGASTDVMVGEGPR